MSQRYLEKFEFWTKFNWTNGNIFNSKLFNLQFEFTFSMHSKQLNYNFIQPLHWKIEQEKFYSEYLFWNPDSCCYDYTKKGNAKRKREKVRERRNRIP